MGSHTERIVTIVAFSHKTTPEKGHNEIPVQARKVSLYIVIITPYTVTPNKICDSIHRQQKYVTIHL